MSRRRRIDPDRLPGNAKTRSSKIEPIEFEGRITMGKRKQGLANDVRNIGNDLFRDIILPAIRSAVADFFTSGIQILIFGQGSDHGDYRDSGYRRPVRSYNKQYSRRGSIRNIKTSRPSNRRMVEKVNDVYQDLYYPNRELAEEVLGRMIERVAEFGVVTIGDLYQMVGVNYNTTHERYGWDDLRGVGVHYTSDGYIIDFPDPFYLE